jgi:hypothetical protein
MASFPLFYPYAPSQWLPLPPPLVRVAASQIAAAEPVYLLHQAWWLVLEIGKGTLPEAQLELGDNASFYSAWVFDRERSPGNNKLLGSLDLPQRTAAPMAYRLS